MQVRARKDMISYSECIHSINTLLSLFNASSTVEVFIRAIVFILLHNGKYFIPIYTTRTGLIILRSTKAISKPRAFLIETRALARALPNCHQLPITLALRE